MSARYGRQVIEDVKYRKEWAQKVGLGFDLPPASRPRTLIALRALRISWSTIARQMRKSVSERVLVVGAKGFEPSTSWSRTSGQNHISRCPGVTYWFSGRSLMDKSGQATA